MSLEPLASSADNLNTDVAGGEVLDQAERTLSEGLAAIQRGLERATALAERGIRDGLATLRAEARAYEGPAGEALEEAQRYVVERIRARPVTATFAGLGVGLLLGVLLSSRGK